MEEILNDLFCLTEITSVSDILCMLPKANSTIWTDGSLIYCQDETSANEVADWIYCVLRNVHPWIGIGQYIHDADNRLTGWWYVEVLE